MILGGKLVQNLVLNYRQSNVVIFVLIISEEKKYYVQIVEGLKESNENLFHIPITNDKMMKSTNNFILV